MVTMTSLFFCYQVFYLYIPLLKKPCKDKDYKKSRFAIMIAARNEEAVIPHLLDSIRAQDYPAELIDAYVIADNCTDTTAQLAREHGAIVFERFNRKQIGKGYAINYLLEKIRENGGWDRYDAFLIIDADNLLEPDYIRNINRMPAQGYDAFCGFRNTKNFGTNWITSGYGLWYLHESTHMNRSRMVIRSECHVNGTGFGFSRKLLEQMGGWNFFTLTEDLEFNNYCATHGIRIGYCHDAVLYDEQPLTFIQSWKQRTRWTQGGMQVSVKYGLRLLRGLFAGGWQSYSCFELLTLSLWGYFFTTLTGVSTVLVALLCLTGLDLVQFFISVLGGAYLALVFMGAWTLVLEWNRVRATTAQKIRSVFTFPFFMMTFAPIALCAMFTKFQWEPIEHTVAISAAELSGK